MIYSPMFAFFYRLDITTAVAASIVIQLAGVVTTVAGHFFGRNTDHPMSVRPRFFGVGEALAAWAIKDRIPVTAVEVVFFLSMLTIGIWLFVGTRSRDTLPVVRRAFVSSSVLTHPADSPQLSPIGLSGRLNSGL